MDAFQKVWIPFSLHQLFFIIQRIFCKFLKNYFETDGRDEDGGGEGEGRPWVHEEGLLWYL